MSLRNDLANVMARDCRYTIHAYLFIFESIDFAKKQRKREVMLAKLKGKKVSSHVSAKQLCEGACDLALEQYGLLARIVLKQWGIRSTSDLGELVYNLIDSGDLERAPNDARADFEGLFDLEDALTRKFVLTLDDVA